MSIARLLGALALTTLAVPTHAQQPTVDASAVAMRAQPLPVLDDYGVAISEDLIRATMRGKGRRALLNPLTGALIGLSVFALATNPGLECSIYEPCTPREEFYMNTGPVVGMIVGILVGAALPDGSVNREQAVALLRDRRRAASAGGTP